jgi:2-polyprenyl-3-methyl-5-hydroxy-6-metoxy-1,4-benzoquinol methylase
LRDLSHIHPRYGWSDARRTEAHAYLLPIVLREVRALAQGRALRVIDIGCGNGVTASLLAEEGHNVTAVDASPDGIEIARAAYPRVRFEVCSVYEDRLPGLTAGPADCVVSLEVVEHLLYPKALFEQCRRVLHAGGRVIVSTPYHGYLKNLAISFVNGWDRHFTVGWDGGHIKFFSKRSLAEMAKAAGFTKVRFVGVGRIPGLWKSMILVAEK